MLGFSSFGPGSEFGPGPLSAGRETLPAIRWFRPHQQTPMCPYTTQTSDTRAGGSVAQHTPCRVSRLTTPAMQKHPLCKTSVLQPTTSHGDHVACITTPCVHGHNRSTHPQQTTKPTSRKVNGVATVLQHRRKLAKSRLGSRGLIEKNFGVASVLRHSKH